MSGVLEIESAISRLASADYEKLMLWWSEHHLGTVKQKGESPELESALLKGLAGESRSLNDAWFDEIRARTQAKLLP